MNVAYGLAVRGSQYSSRDLALKRHRRAGHWLSGFRLGTSWGDIGYLYRHGILDQRTMLYSWLNMLSPPLPRSSQYQRSDAPVEVSALGLFTRK